ncbi:extracellular solute-binding protein, partial [Clostridium chrysemydis]|uniref:extracellular solute-binding protein n=1 Tax=Clostridium chrysemydis TaxID=2665504 RepID=UPI003F317672
IVLMIGSSIYLKLYSNDLVIYTTQDNDDIKTLIKGFEKDHPEIKIDLVKGSTGPITAKLLLEKGNPQADVVWNLDASSALILESQDILASYKPSNLENIDSKFYDTKNDIPKWVGTTIDTATIIYNKDAGDKKGIPEPKSYEDLTNPIYKGEIVMPSPIASGTGYAAVNSWLQTKGEKGAWDYMDKLNKNIKYYSASGSAPSKSTAIGEQVVGISFDKSAFRVTRDVKEAKVVLPKEGLPWTVNVVALLNKKNLKPEAKVFYDWAISQETMKEYAKLNLLISEKNAKPSSEAPKDFDKMLGKNNLHIAADNKTGVCKEWEKRYSEGD